MRFLQHVLLVEFQVFERIGVASMGQSEAVLSPKSLLSGPSGPIRSIEVRPIRSHVRVPSIDRLTTSPREEALVIDERSALRPAQVVENKMMRMIKNASLPVSHLQMRGLLRSRQPAS